MPTALATIPLDYASPAPDGRGRRAVAALLARRCALAACALMLATVWVGSYLYFRARHSLSGVYAAAPIPWTRINYDEHYPWAVPLFHAHQPLAWLDQRITGTEVTMRKNDFRGNPDNYPLEYFN